VPLELDPVRAPGRHKYAEYGIEFDASSYSEPGALHPQRVIVWSSFAKDAIRFTFGD